MWHYQCYNLVTLLKLHRTAIRPPLNSYFHPAGDLTSLNFFFQAPKELHFKRLSKIKMATSNPNQTSSDIEEYLSELLECPVCMETIKSVPVYQCSNGHVICKGCIEKLNNCPICRNDSTLNRNLKLENIVQRLEGIQPENCGPITTNLNLQKWGKKSVRSYRTINGPNQVAHNGINLQTNPWQATPTQDTPTQAMPSQATPRQGTFRPDTVVINNQEMSEGYFLCMLFGIALLLVSFCALFYIFI